MLVRFNVRNFLSFSERVDQTTRKSLSQEFSMLPGKTRSKDAHISQTAGLSVLKFAAVYGANAAGKSNLIKSINFFRNYIVEGNMAVGSEDMYCKTDPANKKKTSYFEAEFLLDGQLYAYGFELILSERSLASEWLCRISRNEEKYLFKKDNSKEKYVFDKELEGNKTLDLLSSAFAGSGRLFLSAINTNTPGFFKDNSAAVILRKVFNWFANTLSVNFPDNPLRDTSFITDSKAFEEASKIMKAFGTGIDEVQKNEVPVEKVMPSINPGIYKMFRRQFDNIKQINKNFAQKELKTRLGGEILAKSAKDLFILRVDTDGNEKAYEVQFLHKFKDDVLFDMKDESDGTLRLFDLLEILLTKENKVYVIDELDRRLHPCLTYQFVKIFFEYAKKRNIQLIVTTHESRLLDFDLLRKDEIWFVEKQENGESNVYSLDEYNVRFDKIIDKAYMEGRYGGVPVFTTIFPVDE